MSPNKIAPAFDKVDVPFSKHKVNVQEGKKIYIEQTGSLIEISDKVISSNKSVNI